MSAARLLLRVAGALLAAVAAYAIVSALQPSSASAAANPGGEDDSSLLGLTAAVTAPVLEAAAPVVEPVVAGAAPVAEQVVAALEPVVAPVVAAAAPVVQPLVAPVVAAVPVVGVIEPVVAPAAPVVGAGVRFDEQMATAVESAVARVHIIVDRLVGTLELVDAFDTVVGLVDRVTSSVPEAPPLSNVVGPLPSGLDPVVELPSVPEPTVVTPSPPTRTSQQVEPTIVPEVVTELPSLGSTPDAAIAVHAHFFRRLRPPGSSSVTPSELTTLEKPPVGVAQRATPSLDLDLRVTESISGGPLTAPAQATPLPATQGPTPASSGSGGDPIPRSHAVVPSSAPCVDWLSRGVTTDVSWTSALFVLSIECPG